MRLTLKTLCTIALNVTITAGAVPAAAQYPSRPIELVVSYQPGGGTDAMARAFAEAARPLLPEPFVVSNKAGASGSIGLSYVANGTPDGYRAAMVFAELLAIPLMGISKVSYEQFQPIARFTSDPSSITVRSDSPWKTAEEFFAYAKANPGKVTISNAGSGTMPHLAAASLGENLGTSFTHVPYPGSAPAILGLVGGQVDATTVAYGELRSHVDSGRLRTLAIMSDKRLPVLPEVPTLRERHVDLTFSVWRGIAVAKSSPPEVVNKLREVAKKVAADPAFRETLAKQNLTFAYADAGELQVIMSTQHEAFKKLIPKLGLKN
ncbi:MAG: tripartite tricarboxylate transporter substrate binding protein [Alcaligenaceae bacterium]|nr:MAG: tripartite tricarboxylate transporter substrate binding protein [Alcaligenaceae bacterium]